ncbi:hypothetical protein [Marinimicrobium sp. ABcell2]|uniref:hypothetical protein n=1 Tax=Marinimicrobium sp. ABcell2 TaxID=3069751 RepID=UPI0027AEAF16|nr:hypothetical protein [Marinimicrobium sp. ABcell2]MDQ2076824.1 hypothetical protein [Marinimicrobium sp. ABcell2]
MSTTSTNMSTSRIRLAALLLLCAAATGCAIHEGDERHVNPPTLGAELTDLQAALDEGVITEQEHAEIKRRLIRAQSR